MRCINYYLVLLTFISTGCITGTITGKFQTREVGVIEIKDNRIAFDNKEFEVFKSRNYLGQTRYFTARGSFVLDWRVRRFYIFEGSARWPDRQYEVKHYKL